MVAHLPIGSSCRCCRCASAFRAAPGLRLLDLDLERRRVLPVCLDCGGDAAPMLGSIVRALEGEGVADPLEDA